MLFMLPNRTVFFRSLLLVLLAWTMTARAQVTTSALNGKVTSDKGEDLIGVTVVATNVPTGTKRGTGTEVDGHYVIPNLLPGGPYSITVTYVGYKPVTIDGIFLTLGNTARQNFVLAAEAQQLNEVVVLGSTEATKTGAGTNVGREQIRTLPTISRSIQDFTRLDPRNSNNSFAGSSFRYNNITLDGAINNDAIGFSPSLGGVGGSSGLPGGSSRANPISLDAIQEIQAQIAPFDVKLGNFTGGSVNAVTRSGTNDFHGSVYGFGRNQSITGNSIDGTDAKIGTAYHDYQTGFRLGGPLVKDKLFFFTNAEIARNQAPVFYGAGTQGSPVTLDLASKIASNLQTKYNYNPGVYQNANTYANSNKIFGRLDFNLNDKTSLVLRHNYIKSEATNLERSQSLFNFGSQDFVQNNLQNSTVLEVKSNFSNALSNSLVLGYTNIHDFRALVGGASSVFPQVQINNVGLDPAKNYAGSNQILLGSNREAAIFNQRQKTFEFTDNLTFYKGRHALTLGTHNELYKIDYGFVNSWNGRIEYNNVTDFLNDRPSRVRGSVRNANNGGNNSYDYNYNNPSAQFNINLYSAYLQDEFTVTDNLKISPGIRFDLANLPNKPLLSPLVNATAENSSTNPTYTHTGFAAFNNQVLGQVQFSPRLGFNYDVKGDNSVVVRGGSGVFTGRVPFAWLGYAYYNNGVNFNGVDYTNGVNATTGVRQTVLLNQDPTQIFAQLPASAQTKTEINLIDNHFKMPQVWRSSLAFDFNKLPGGLRASVEGLYTKVIQDVKFEQINLVDKTTYFTAGPTQTPRYAGSGDAQRINPAFSNFFLLTNTQQGYRYQLTGSLSKRFENVLDASVAYTYGQSKDISNGIRNSFQSNWELNPSQTPNNPGLAYSNFDLRHRVVGTFNYHQNLGQRFTGYLTGVFTYQSGTPFTYVYNNNFFGNGQQNVQLAYVPQNAGDVVLVDPTSVAGTGALRAAAPATGASLDNFLSNDPYLSTRRGAYTERNGAHTPWNNQADMRFMLEAHLGNLTPNAAGVTAAGHTIQVSFDLINVGNLLNRNWGRKFYTPDTFNSTAGFGLNQVGFADAGGNLSRTYSATTFNQPAFTYSPLSGPAYSVDPFSSRWQGQLGLRYSF